MLKKAFFLFLFFFINTIAYAELPKEDIVFITNQAIVLCEKIEFTGSRNKLDISGSASIELNKLAKIIVDSSIQGNAKYSSDKYKGFIQGELLPAYNSKIECRQKFSTQLISFLLVENKKCDNPIYKMGRGEVCGVERYNSIASSECEILEYNTGTSAACGVDQYKHCESGSCGWNSCGFIRRCDAKECRTVACGVERYKTCKHSSFGVRSYKRCRNKNHGVEVYKACRNEEFGIERCS